MGKRELKYGKIRKAVVCRLESNHFSNQVYIAICANIIMPITLILVSVGHFGYIIN